jgi:AcrR family transcriptional regulator
MPDVATRTYRQTRRADDAARTRKRIVAATRRLTVAGGAPSVDAIASGAKVSVQTIYAQFGSKRGLLLATMDEVQRDAGLYAAFGEVWSSPDGETALRRMVDATIRLWDGAWPFVEWFLRSAREDPETAASLRVADTGRHRHLWEITKRLGQEGRLRQGRSPEHAADMVFAMTTPTAYEELVRVRGWTLDAAVAGLSDAALTSIVEPGTHSRRTPPPDWSVAIALLDPERGLAVKVEV